MQLKHRFAAKLSSTALVGLAGISKAVAKHDFVRCKRRCDHLLNVLHAGCEHKRQFRIRSQRRSPAIQQELTNFFRRLRASWLASFHHSHSLRPESGGKLSQLRALSAAVQPFEGYEFSAMWMSSHEAR